MKYFIINKIYNLPFSNYLGGFIKKKLLKKNNITFIPTNKKILPIKNYPIQNSIEYQEKIINFYNNNNYVSFNTYLNLKNLLKDNFKSDETFNFLDFGGDKLDFFLDISKEFKNKINALKFYKKELRKYPHSRSTKGVETLARFRGISCGVNYAEGFYLNRLVE